MKQFYETVEREQFYGHESDPEKHPFYKLLSHFIERWDLDEKKCLEIGSAKGLFQDVVKDYTGADISENLSIYYHKKFVAVSGAELPFPDESYDAIFSYATHEHIPDLELALNEIIRVLRHGGVCLFAPAWHTRPWSAKGYQVRPYGDLTLAEKLIKLTLPVIDSVFIRWPFVFLRRLTRMFFYIVFSPPLSSRDWKQIMKYIGSRTRTRVTASIRLISLCGLEVVTLSVMVITVY